jgi:hypothetical protein
MQHLQTMLTPKEIERLSVEKYLKASNQYYEIEDFESPDFILRGNGNEIGCEVTEFYPDYSPKGSTLRKRESYLNDFHQKLKLSLLNQYPKGFSFDLSYKPTGSKKCSNDEEVESVCLNIQKNINSRLINNPSTNISRIFIRRIEDIPTRITQMIFSDYAHPKAEWFKPIIVAKTNKMKKWNGIYDYKWLIISTGLSRSGEITVGRIKHLENLKSAFWDKIILIDIHFADYIEIDAT